MTPGEFAVAFRENFRVLWWIATGVVNDRTLAEDVVQEAAVHALQKLDQFKPGQQDSSFSAWMGQIVRFVALNQRRKQIRQNTPSVDGRILDGQALDREASQSPQAVGSDSSLRLGETGQLPDDQPWFDDKLIAALNEVDETARACLLLRTLEGLSYQEIATILNIPQGTAMSHVHRTRKWLRQELADKEGSRLFLGT